METAAAWVVSQGEMMPNKKPQPLPPIGWGWGFGYLVQGAASDSTSHTIRPLLRPDGPLCPMPGAIRADGKGAMMPQQKTSFADWGQRIGSR